MSPTAATRFTDAATVSRLLEDASHASAIEDDRLKDDACSHGLAHVADGKPAKRREISELLYLHCLERLDPHDCHVSRL